MLVGQGLEEFVELVFIGDDREHGGVKHGPRLGPEARPRQELRQQVRERDPAVGDNKYVTDAPQTGSVYLCRAPQGGQAGGAGSRGPWFSNNDTEYDINQKLAVQGNVSWDASYSETISGGNRVITTNDLPRDHTTGVFPVQPSDPAYQYDRNPN